MTTSRGFIGKVPWMLPPKLGSSLALLLGLLCSCSNEQKATEPGKIPEGAFAIVGERPLSVALLRGTKGTERRERALGIVRDELMRQEAEALDSSRAGAVRRGELGRRLIEQTELEVSQKGPISEEELRAEYDARWLDFNRPRAVRTVQVFFPVEPPVEDEVQRLHAERLAKAVLGTHNLDEFGKKAKPIIDEVESSVVYEMPPLTRDGRIVPILPKDRNVGGISKYLADAVGALSEPGDISSVVGTEQGYHVFFVTEVVPEKIVPMDQVKKELERAVVAKRVQNALDAISKNPKVPITRRRSDIANLLTLVQQEK